MIRNFKNFIIKENLKDYLIDRDSYKTILNLTALRTVLADFDIYADELIYDNSPLRRMIEKFFREIDDLHYNALKQVAIDNGLNIDKVEADDLRFSFDDEVEKRVKQFYKKISSNH